MNPTEQKSNFNESIQIPKKGYWYGYCYAAFWAYITLCSASKAFLLIKATIDRVDFQGQQVTAAHVLIPSLATVFLGYATYRLLIRKVSMLFIYTLVAMHALNVFLRGMIPVELLVFISFSYIVIFKFRKSFTKPST
jgi:hypothetical protein